MLKLSVIPIDQRIIAHQSKEILISTIFPFWWKLRREHRLTVHYRHLCKLKGWTILAVLFYENARQIDEDEEADC